MTIAQKMMQRITEEALRTGSREIKLGTLNSFMNEIGLGPNTNSARGTSKRFQKQMVQLLKDSNILADAVIKAETIHIFTKQQSRVGAVLQKLMHSMKSRALRWLRQS